MTGGDLRGLADLLAGGATGEQATYRGDALAGGIGDLNRDGDGVGAGVALELYSDQRFGGAYGVELYV